MGLFDFFSEETGNNISEADVVSCILPFFLPQILEYAKGQEDGRNKNITKIGSSQLYGTDPNDPILGYRSILPFSDPKVAKELPSYINLFSKRDPNTLLCEENLLYNLEENVLFFNRVSPYIKLIKIFEENDGTFTDVHVPLEVIYDASNIENNILNGGGDGAVGISTFNWTSEGRNEANRTQYHVNFKLILQNISELTKIRNTEKGKDVRLLDLLYPVNDAGEIPTSAANQYEPSKQLLKAEVGYNLPEEYEKYKNYFKTTLSLYLHKHNFTFVDNGRVELEITYIANIDNEFGNSLKWNVLNEEGSQELQDAIKRINAETLVEGRIKYGKNWEYSGNILTRSQGIKLPKYIPPDLRNEIAIKLGNDSGSFVSFVALTLEGKKIVENVLYEKLSILKLSIFVSLIKNLKKKKKIYSYTLDNKKYQTLKLLVTSNNLEEETFNKLKLAIDGNFQRTAPAPAPTGSNLSAEDIRKETSAWEKFINIFGSIEQKKDIIDQEKLSEFLKPQNFNDDTMKRQDFIFLGDLLQGIIDTALSEKEKDKFQIFLSPFTYIDYQSIKDKQFKNIYEDRKNSDGSTKKTLNIKNLERKTHSIAYIPISISSISRWFQTEIIETNETHYSLFKLIRTAMTKLISESIGVRKAPNSPTQYFSTINFNFNTKDKFDTSDTTLISIESLSSFYSSRNSIFQNNSLHNNIVFISSREDNMSDFKGDRAEDCKKNIFHIELNHATSLVAKANFRRDDNAKLETANLLASSDNKPNEIIRQVYHCSLEMVGNNFFEPGSLIYIRPSYPGTNLQMEILNQIGLGGYYRIITIENKLTPSGYITNLNCKWEMWGKGVNP